MSHGSARKTSVYQLISDAGDPVSIHKQPQEGRFSFSKKRTEVFTVYLGKTNQRKTISGGFFLTGLPDITLQNLSQLYIFQSVTKHRKKGFNLMTEHQSLTINHGPPPYGGHIKEQSTYRCTLKNITIKNNHRLKDI